MATSFVFRWQDAMAVTQTVAPSDVRFIQKRIDRNFKRGSSVNLAISSIESGLLSHMSFPNIKVIKMKGKFYSFDNRRLYMFRVLECRGFLNEIEVQQVDPSRLIPSRFDTENDGVSVTMTGGIAYPHVPERLRKMVEEEEEKVKLDKYVKSLNSRHTYGPPFSPEDSDDDSDDDLLTRLDELRLL